MIRFKFTEYVYPKRLPWKDIFKDLDSHVNQSELSELLGLGWSSYQSCRDSLEPKHSIAVSIITLHTRYCGETLTRQRLEEEST